MTAPDIESRSEGISLETPLRTSLRCWPVVLICLSLIGATLFIYSSVGDHEFLRYDDPAYIMAEPHVLRGLTAEGIAWAFSLAGHAGNWHPLTSILYMTDVQLLGLRPGPHHWVSVVLHLLSGVLLFLVFLRMTGATGRSAFVAALFLLHPLHVESVAWAAELKDVLSAFFFMLTLWAYVSYVRRSGTLRYFAVCMLFALGLMSKPMLVTLPFVLLLLDVWPLSRLVGDGEIWRGGARLVIEKIPLFVMSVLSSVVTIVVQQRSGAVTAWDQLSLQARVANALVSYVAYIGKMLWPLHLGVFYPYDANLPMRAVIGSAALLLLMSVIAIWQVRQCPYLFTGWFWYLGMLVPVIGLVQAGAQSMADRYTYLPSIGLCIIVAWGAYDSLESFPARNAVLAAAGLVEVLSCVVVARTQVRYWHDGVSLWQHTLMVTTPDNSGYTNLAFALAQQNRGNEAIAEYGKALRLMPAYAPALEGLAVSLADRGEYAEAAVRYEQALQLLPGNPDYHNNYGVSLARLGRIDEARGQFLEAIRLKPDYADPHNNLAGTYVEQGRIQEAMQEYMESLRIKPGADAEYNLGLLYQRSGSRDEARRHYKAALLLAPSSIKVRNALDQLGP